MSGLRDSYSSTQRSTKQWLVNKAKYSKNRDGAGKIRKPQQIFWSCNSDPNVCGKPKHPRIMCAVHGSKEDAERCNKRYIQYRLSLEG